jgi:hypothetical protein
VAAETARHFDRERSADGDLVCAECARVARGHDDPVVKRGDVPITMPNTNFPNTH